jgi:hypothetical protein
MRKIVSIAALLSLSASCAAVARAETVGSVGAVNQSAQGTPPGGAPQGLSLGSSVVDRERIETKADGKAQIIFLDKSTLAVGANSAVTINHFVYDSHAGVGQESVSLAKGALRFIGGEISHGGGAQINTPSASIAVRGGMVMVHADGRRGDQIILLGGVVTIRTTKGLTTQLTRPGYGVIVAPGGAGISDPAPSDNLTLESFEKQFASLPGQSGGARVPPGEAQAERRLGDSRLPDFTPWAGLGALNPFWTGSAIVQSHAQANNQTRATQWWGTINAIGAGQGGPPPPGPRSPPGPPP